MLRDYEECRVKRTLVTVNLVSRRLVINRRWCGIDRYLLTVDDSTVSRVDILCIIDGSFISGSPLATQRSERSLGHGGAFSGALVCGPVLGLLMNDSELSRLAIRREAWRKDR
jgi:hypothetical protein